MEPLLQRRQISALESLCRIWKFSRSSLRKCRPMFAVDDLKLNCMTNGDLMSDVQIVGSDLLTISYEIITFDVFITVSFSWWSFLLSPGTNSLSCDTRSSWNFMHSITTCTSWPSYIDRYILFIISWSLHLDHYIPIITCCSCCPLELDHWMQRTLLHTFVGRHFRLNLVTWIVLYAVCPLHTYMITEMKCDGACHCKNPPCSLGGGRCPAKHPECVDGWMGPSCNSPGL